MEQSIAQHHSIKLIGQRNVFLLFSIVLLCVVFLLAGFLFFKRERIVVVPTTGASYWVEEGRVSENYLEQMGMFLSDLLLNRSPADVEKRNAMILQHVHPSSFHEIKKLLQQEEKNIFKEEQAFFFQAEKSFVDAPHNAFVITGEFFVAVATQGKASSFTQRTKKVYTLQFLCENGRLFLQSVHKKDV